MNVRTSIVSIIAALAAIGFVSMLITSPGQLMRQIVFAVVIVSVVVLLFRLMQRKQMGKLKSEDRAYSKAVKQSKKRHDQKPKYNPKPSKPMTLSAKPKKKPARRRKNTHLTVIEGSKGKRRSSRASSE